MRKDIFKKGMVVGIIALFVGALLWGIAYLIRKK